MLPSIMECVLQLCLRHCGSGTAAHAGHVGASVVQDTAWHKHHCSISRTC